MVCKWLILRDVEKNQSSYILMYTIQIFCRNCGIPRNISCLQIAGSIIEDGAFRIWSRSTSQSLGCWAHGVMASLVTVIFQQESFLQRKLSRHFIVLCSGHIVHQSDTIPLLLQVSSGSHRNEQLACLLNQVQGSEYRKIVCQHEM